MNYCRLSECLFLSPCSIVLNLQRGSDGVVKLIKGNRALSYSRECAYCMIKTSNQNKVKLINTAYVQM